MLQGIRQRARVSRVSGAFPSHLKEIVGKKWSNANLNKRGKRSSAWGEFVEGVLGDKQTANGFLLKSNSLKVVSSDIEWRRCDICTTVQPLNPLAGTKCYVHFGQRACGGTTSHVNPLNDTVFRSRKEHFRRHTERLRADENYTPHPYIAAEHSAALNDSANNGAVARAEWHELRFQDLDVVRQKGSVKGRLTCCLALRRWKLASTSAASLLWR